MRMARGLPMRGRSAPHASPAAPGCRACMGEPWEMKTLGSMALLQAFRLQGLLHLRTGPDARKVGGEVGPLGEVDLGRRGPAQDGKEIRVRYRELLAHQVVLAGELLVEPVEAVRQVVFSDLLVLVRRGR